MGRSKLQPNSRYVTVPGIQPSMDRLDPLPNLRYVTPTGILFLID